MRRRMIIVCVGWVAATIAAPWVYAQNSNGHPGQSGAPVADQFVSTPGQMVSTPGQMVTGPGQMVTMPGQVVIPPGMSVVSPGPVISPTPGMITPFHAQPQQGSGTSQIQQNGGQGVDRGGRFHSRHRYRPEYGVSEGYALPYMVNGDYGAVSSEPVEAAGSVSSTGRSMMGVSEQAGYGAAEQAGSLADAPSGNRPPYRPEREAQPGKRPAPRDEVHGREPVLVIVMKDGSRREVRNYALTAQTLIDLDGAARGKEVEIPLSEVNLVATKKAAAQAGLSFAVPRR